MVDFGINRTQENVPNLPNVNHTKQTQERAVEQAEKKLIDEKPSEIKDFQKTDAATSAKEILESAVKDAEAAKVFEQTAFSGTQEELEDAVKEMNDVSRLAGSKLRFGYNQDIGEVVVEVLDENNNVERTIPPDYLIQLKLRLKEHVGQLLDREL